MGKILNTILAGITALGISGCYNISNAELTFLLKDEDKIVTCYENDKGYEIRVPFSEMSYTHIEEDMTCILTADNDESLCEKCKITLIDNYCDAFVDSALIGNDYLSREENEKLFQEIDQRNAAYKNGLKVERTHEKWLKNNKRCR